MDRPSMYATAIRLQDNFRAYATVRETLEHERMRNAPVYHVDLAHASAQGIQRTVGFWDHPAGDDSFLLELRHGVLVQRWNERAVIFGIPHHAEHVTQEDQLARLQAFRERAGRHI